MTQPITNIRFGLYDDSLSELAKLSLIDLSYSRLDTYTMCPAKYFYGYIQKLPRPFAPAATLGNILHDVLEEHIDVQYSLDDLIVTYEEKRKEYDPELLIPNNLIDDGIYILKELFDVTDGAPEPNVIGKEQYFNFVIGRALIRGYIDRIDYDEATNTVSIIDYKSGKFEVAAKNVSTNLQLGIYALAASLLYPGKKIYAELYYLRSGRRKGHIFSELDLEGIKETLYDLTEKLIEDTSFSATKNESPCIRFCEYARTGDCRTGEVRFRKNSR